MPIYADSPISQVDSSPGGDLVLRCKTISGHRKRPRSRCRHVGR